ncbi:hypothetical protein AB0G04_38170 [Actinoplanes sp. NPDC023801]|uniref:hypothetical protein n=1 Tax=Actinoplanes sp. NPDC023801 TaxID=3154595 RepID=UPI0033C3AA7A
MAVLRIDASIQGPNSASTELADLVEKEISGAPIVRRHLAADPLPADVWAHAIQAAYLPADQRSDSHHRAVALAGELAGELRAADAVILAAAVLQLRRLAACQGLDRPGHGRR